MVNRRLMFGFRVRCGGVIQGLSKSAGMALVLALVAVPVLAAAPPLPRAKPAVTNGAAAQMAPKPRPKPSQPKPPAPPAAPAVPPAPAQAAPPPPVPGLPRAVPVPLPNGRGQWAAEEVAAGREACRQQLKGLDLEWAEAAPLGHPGGCGAAAPITLSKVGGLAIEPPAETSCAMAAGLAFWVANSLKPAAERQLGQKLTGLRNATSYACRGRNGAMSGKLSQHALANALDISAFLMADGTAITVKDDWGLGLNGKGAFLRTVHKALCPVFATVLGPGSDGFHEDHFHVDMMVRRGGYRICE